MSKFGAIPTRCGAGHDHASKLEAKRCDQLTAMEAAGTISHLVQQPEFRIVIDGKLICRYVGDFQYRMVDNGLPVSEDVKGVQTRVFQLKRKLVEAMYPGTVVTVWPVKVRKKRKGAYGKA